MKIFSYNMRSKSAKALAQALGILQVRHNGRPLNMEKQTLINWGCSTISRRIYAGKVLNPPEAIGRAVDKLEAFKTLNGYVLTPEWTERREDALAWLQNGYKVVARCILNGHSGEGLVIASTEEELPHAPLYVQYVKKEDEYRVHVFQGEVFFIQRKARKKDVPDDQVNWQVRNHANGFIFAHKDVEIGGAAKDYAIRAVERLGLDFGAVDIMLSKKDGRYLVLEVNTACGLSGTTLDKYVEKFKQFK